MVHVSVEDLFSGEQDATLVGEKEIKVAVEVLGGHVVTIDVEKIHRMKEVFPGIEVMGMVRGLTENSAVQRWSNGILATKLREASSGENHFWVPPDKEVGAKLAAAMFEEAKVRVARGEQQKGGRPSRAKKAKDKNGGGQKEAGLAVDFGGAGAMDCVLATFFKEFQGGELEVMKRDKKKKDKFLGGKNELRDESAKMVKILQVAFEDDILDDPLTVMANKNGWMTGDLAMLTAACDVPVQEEGSGKEGDVYSVRVQGEEPHGVIPINRRARRIGEAWALAMLTGTVRDVGGAFAVFRKSLDRAWEREAGRGLQDPFMALKMERYLRREDTGGLDSEVPPNIKAWLNEVVRNTDWITRTEPLSLGELQRIFTERYSGWRWAAGAEPIHDLDRRTLDELMTMAVVWKLREELEKGGEVVYHLDKAMELVFSYKGYPSTVALRKCLTSRILNVMGRQVSDWVQMREGLIFREDEKVVKAAWFVLAQADGYVGEGVIGKEHQLRHILSILKTNQEATLGGAAGQFEVVRNIDYEAVWVQIFRSDLSRRNFSRNEHARPYVEESSTSKRLAPSEALPAYSLYSRDQLAAGDVRQMECLVGMWEKDLQEKGTGVAAKGATSGVAAVSATNSRFGVGQQAAKRVESFVGGSLRRVREGSRGGYGMEEPASRTSWTGDSGVLSTGQGYSGPAGDKRGGKSTMDMAPVLFGGDDYDMLMMEGEEARVEWQAWGLSTNLVQRLRLSDRSASTGAQRFAASVAETRVRALREGDDIMIFNIRNLPPFQKDSKERARVEEGTIHFGGESERLGNVTWGGRDGCLNLDHILRNTSVAVYRLGHKNDDKLELEFVQQSSLPDSEPVKSWPKEIVVRGKSEDRVLRVVNKDVLGHTVFRFSSIRQRDEGEGEDHRRGIHPNGQRGRGPSPSEYDHYQDTLRVGRGASGNSGSEAPGFSRRFTSFSSSGTQGEGRVGSDYQSRPPEGRGLLGKRGRSEELEEFGEDDSRGSTDNDWDDRRRYRRISNYHVSEQQGGGVRGITRDLSQRQAGYGERAGSATTDGWQGRRTRREDFVGDGYAGLGGGQMYDQQARMSGNIPKNSIFDNCTGEVVPIQQHLEHQKFYRDMRVYRATERGELGPDEGMLLTSIEAQWLVGPLKKRAERLFGARLTEALWGLWVMKGLLAVTVDVKILVKFLNFEWVECRNQGEGDLQLWMFTSRSASKAKSAREIRTSPELVDALTNMEMLLLLWLGTDESLLTETRLMQRIAYPKRDDLEDRSVAFVRDELNDNLANLGLSLRNRAEDPVNPLSHLELCNMVRNVVPAINVTYWHYLEYQNRQSAARSSGNNDHITPLGGGPPSGGRAREAPAAQESGQDHTSKGRKGAAPAQGSSSGGKGQSTSTKDPILSRQICLADFRKAVDPTFVGCVASGCDRVHFASLSTPIKRTTVKNAFDKSTYAHNQELLTQIKKLVDEGANGTGRWFVG